MQRRVFTLASFGTLAFALAACGGGGGTSGGPLVTPTTAPSTTPQNTARGTLSFLIPINNSGFKGLTSRANRATLATRTPKFVDGASNGAVTMYLDHHLVMDHQNFAPPPCAPPGPCAGPSGGPLNLPDGTTFSYTSQVVFVTNNPGSTPANQPYVQVSGTFTTIPGPHTLGVVQTDGPCPGPDPCIPNTSGFVLAEGQKSFNLAAGSGNTLSMALRGVMQSVYICDIPNCDGQNVNPDPTTGVTNLYVVVADEAGTAIPFQLESDGVTQVPFDNGGYTFSENDGGSILTITQPSATGTYTFPGKDRHGQYGENVSIKCNHTGTATVAAQLLASDPSTGSVTDYTYTSQNYPQGGAMLGLVGADQFFGSPPLTINCSASGSISIY